ncbi:unnamed protein product [marine sediment metagenome]|uniref:Nucleotidyl transferase domain-containing protein n=1 Tax=marine sediment metagenome TaxID=412755 RepID=X0VMS7_9ZZZZ
MRRGYIYSIILSRPAIGKAREAGMHHAVILACDPGVDLRPLTSEETPTAFPALGDRRTLLQRSIDRLVECIPVENLWAIVLPQHRARAEAELPRAIHVVADSDGGGLVGSLATALAEATSSEGRPAAVLLQPAIHVVVDEAGYRKRLLAGLDVASSNGLGVSFTVGSVRGEERATGIQAWPADVLSERLASVAHGEPTSIRDALSAGESKLTVVPLGNVG